MSTLLNGRQNHEPLEPHASYDDCKRTWIPTALCIKSFQDDFALQDGPPGDAGQVDLLSGAFREAGSKLPAMDICKSFIRRRNLEQLKFSCQQMTL